MGKVMFLWGTAQDGQLGTAEGPQWALGGDTWVVGCAIPSCTVFPEFNSLNPDQSDEKMSTEVGVYQPGCGLDALLFAYGHDEYMYQMLTANAEHLAKTGATVHCIPPEGLAMIRYHSAYPWHTGGAYRVFMTDHDQRMMQWVLEFNKFDLYTKDQMGLDRPVEELWDYYQTIIDKYLPGGLMW
jgi:inositol oxygenase